MTALNSLVTTSLQVRTRRLERRVRDFVAPYLQPRESVDVVLADTFGGRSNSFWFTRSYSLVLTNERALVIRRSTFFGYPRTLEGQYPRNSTKVIEYRRGFFWSFLRLRLPGDPDLRLNIRRIVRSSADDFVRALDPAIAS